MKAVIQRVKQGSVTVEGRRIAEIGRGLVILVGVGPEDSEENARALARKIALLRIFEDDQHKMNRSLLDMAGEALVVSQFTLFADTRKGNRPAFTAAALPGLAKPLCQRFAALLREQGIATQEGEFGAHMVVEIINDGPVTIQMEL